MSQLGLGMTQDDAPADAGRRRPRRGGGALAIAVLALVVVGIAAFLGLRSLGGSPSDFTGDGTGEVTVVVAKGDSLREIGRTLAAAGVVATEDAFVEAASAEPDAERIAPGSYALRSGMSGEAAVALMLDPASRVVKKVAVPEGWRFERTLAAAAKGTGLSEDALRESLSRAGSLGLPAYAEGNPEGFLFPATYEFQPGVTADQVVERMLKRFDQEAEDIDLDAAAKELGLTPLQVVTVASILEIETAPEDYDRAARVIYNRLKKDMPLQLDSTVNYALGTSELKLTRDQLQVDSPYNTYRNKGLPPGPINSPGSAALQAALNPAKGSWLYWVTTDPANKVTEFATTYEDFLVLKRKFQANAG
ncbi:MAG: endolytic transglycosylase MltG [Candidatus Nanopelagicales bacterium]|jgi:UPF0755 protein